MLPAIVYIPLIATGYFVFDMFNTEVAETQDKNLQTTEFLNPNLPGAQIKNGDGIGGKYENMAKSYGRIADYSAVDNIERDNEEEKEAYESKYTEEDLAELVRQAEEKDDAAEVADAKARAGRIHQHQIKLPFPLRTEDSSINRCGLNGLKPQPRCAVMNALQLILMDVAGKHRPSIPHLNGSSKGLTARRGAYIQHPFSRLDSGGHNRKPCSRVLNIKASALKSLHVLQVSGSGEQQACRHPGVRLRSHAFHG